MTTHASPQFLSTLALAYRNGARFATCTPDGWNTHANLPSFHGNAVAYSIDASGRLNPLTDADPKPYPPSAARQTETFHAITRGHNLTCKAGLLTLAQAAELSDAISALRIVCQHSFALTHREMRSDDVAALDGLNLKLSIAKARRILTLWHKWTHPLGSRDCPFGSDQALTYVSGFLSALRRE